MWDVVAAPLVVVLAAVLFLCMVWIENKVG